MGGDFSWKESSWKGLWREWEAPHGRFWCTASVCRRYRGTILRYYFTTVLPYHGSTVPTLRAHNTKIFSVLPSLHFLLSLCFNRGDTSQVSPHCCCEDVGRLFPKREQLERLLKGMRSPPWKVLMHRVCLSSVPPYHTTVLLYYGTTVLLCHGYHCTDLWHYSNTTHTAVSILGPPLHFTLCRLHIRIGFVGGPNFLFGNPDWASLCHPRVTGCRLGPN